jgi:peptide/nickel transport system substrate-binding protein
VRFHDGAPFGADDVVFSIQRALAKTSQRANQLRGITAVRKIDELTVEVQLAAPDAVLPEKLYLVAIMSKAWSEKNDVALPQDYNGKQETFAVRNANGTGPFMLKRYEPDRQLTLARNAAWWGWSAKDADKGMGNVSEATYTVIQADATRLAALASGEVDFVIDPPFQDVARLRADKRLKSVSSADIGMQYLGFDQHARSLKAAASRAIRFVTCACARPCITRLMCSSSSTRCCAARARRSACTCRHWLTAHCPSSTSACRMTRRGPARC